MAYVDNLRDSPAYGRIRGGEGMRQSSSQEKEASLEQRKVPHSDYSSYRHLRGDVANRSLERAGV